MTQFAGSRAESTHHRLYEFAKTALIKIFVHPYATVRVISHTLFLFCISMYKFVVCTKMGFGGIFQGMRFIFWRRSGR